MNSEILNYPLHRFLDSSLIGQFIGVDGVNISRIEKENKVALDIWNPEDAKPTVRITGPYWQLKLALNDVCQLVTRIRGANRRYSFQVPTKDVGFLIGKNGAKIKEIKLNSNADVHLERKEGENTTVTVIGDYQLIVAGLRLIFSRFTSKGEKSVYDNPRTRQFAESLECF